MRTEFSLGDVLPAAAVCAAGLLLCFAGPVQYAVFRSTAQAVDEREAGTGSVVTARLRVFVCNKK